MLPDFTWRPATREDYWHALNCLPPAAERRGMFLVGEASDHRGEGGAPRFRVYRERFRSEYAVGSRPITRAELEILAAFPAAEIAA